MLKIRLGDNFHSSKFIPSEMEVMETEREIAMEILHEIVHQSVKRALHFPVSNISIERQRTCRAEGGPIIGKRFEKLK